MLEFIDFDDLRRSPKWVQGYSDISTLLFAITTRSGIATAHGTNFMDSINGQDRLTSESRNFLRLCEGESLIQRSSDKWQKQFVDFSTKLDTTFNLTEDTKWSLLKGRSTEFSGRIIGGCIDTLLSLIGTPYGDLTSFSDNYAKDEGVILFLENCELLPTDVYRALISMKYAGWFDNLNGLIFGRNNGPDNREFSYLDSLVMALKDLEFPVVFDADIGHLPPQMTIINGSYATLALENHQAELLQKFI